MPATRNGPGADRDGLGGPHAREICEQIKDPARNGGHDMAFIVDHMAHDSLVGWGGTRMRPRPVPGTQAQFGEIIKAWADTGRTARRVRSFRLRSAQRCAACQGATQRSFDRWVVAQQRPSVCTDRARTASTSRAEPCVS
jgi:hypothetical protein